jgi:hypothetical protein
MDMRFGTWNVRINEIVLAVRKLVRCKLDFMVVKEHGLSQHSFQEGENQCSIAFSGSLELE